MVLEMNTVHGINAQYIDFRNASKTGAKQDYLFRSDWSKFLSRHLKNIPYLEKSKYCLHLYDPPNHEF
jgi:hypothetical protein